MNRKLWWIAPLLAVTAAMVPALQDFDRVEIKTIPVAGGVSMLEGAGGNIGVLASDDGLFMIDDQFEPLAPKIQAALDALGKGELRYLLNTHFHGDHTGGNAVFGAAATIVAHDNVRKRLESDMDPAGLPVITYDHTLTIHFGGEHIRVLHFPGAHTDGDSVVIFENAGVVHMGDLFFSGRFPYVDLGSGGSVKGYRDAIATLVDEIPEDARIIPGHGPLSDISDLRDTLDMLNDTIAHVQEQVDAGRSIEEVKSAGLPPQYDGWEWQFISEERWIETLYRSLSG